MTYKNTIISLIMIAIVGIAIWTTLLTHNRQNNLHSAETSPDAFMEEVKSIIMDKQGKPKMIIETPKMVHFAENDITHLLSPQLTLYRKSPKPWYITSKEAQAQNGIDHVNFWDDVIIHHPADEKNPATVIKTSTLMVHPSQQVAETKDVITFIQPHITVKAIGMYADMETGNIRLLSETRGEYVPN